MSKRRFRVRLEGTAIIELDDAVIQVVDDEWRSVFYDLHTPQEIAGHIGYNLIVRHIGLPKLDGWADQPKEYARIIEEAEWEIEAEKEEQVIRVSREGEDV